MSMTDDFGHGTVADQNAINMSGNVVSGIFAPAEKLSPPGGVLLEWPLRSSETLLTFWAILLMAASLLKTSY